MAEDAFYHGRFVNQADDLLSWPRRGQPRGATSQILLRAMLAAAGLEIFMVIVQYLPQGGRYKELRDR